MAYHANIKSRYAAIPAVLVLALVTYAGGSVITDAASASPRQISAVRNDNIKISRGGLETKCKKSGGTFFSNKKNGTYLCAVAKKGGGSTIVGCAENEKCTGITTTPK